MVTFILNYFIMFNVTVNKTVFFISFIDSIWLVYRNETDLGVLILHPETVLNLLISCNMFFCEVYKDFYI